MKIAVLAVQGAFIEHEKALQRLGAETVELRKAEDLEQDFDGLVLPGGESTVQSRLFSVCKSRHKDIFTGTRNKLCDLFL